jgi:hypothetical protein
VKLKRKQSRKSYRRLRAVCSACGCKYYRRRWRKHWVTGNTSCSHCESHYSLWVCDPKLTAHLEGLKSDELKKWALLGVLKERIS